MKGFVIVLIIVAIVCCFLMFPSGNQKYLRIHIRADGNDEESQNVKYLVRDAVVDYLVPILSECETREEALKKVKANLSNIEAVADGILSKNGYAYCSNAEIKSETFPTRTYDKITLVSGVYEALVLNLGRAQGENWWCVIYPPLCFLGGQENGTDKIAYRSKIAEIIRNFYNAG